jgi:hypothetical protein
MSIRRILCDTNFFICLVECLRYNLSFFAFPISNNNSRVHTAATHTKDTFAPRGLVFRIKTANNKYKNLSLDFVEWPIKR